MSDSVRPHGQQPTRLLCPRNSLGKNTGVGCHFLLPQIPAAAAAAAKSLQSLSRFSRVQLCATSWTAAHQAPLSTEFSRQEYWSGLPFPSPMDVRVYKVRAHLIKKVSTEELMLLNCGVGEDS